MFNFIILWILTLVSGSAIGQEKCEYQRTSSLKFSIISQRNLTGHWTAQVTLDHGAAHQVSGPFEVDVEHTVVKCNEKESVIVVTTVTAPPYQVPADPSYKLLPGLGYYKFHDTPTTWYRAVKKCMEENSYLLIINSSQEFSELKKKWDESGVKGDFLHIGINDFDKEAEFVTLFGDPLNSTGYSKWAPNEPNSGNTANCGAVKRTGEFYDSYCSNTFPFFCEYNSS